MVLGQAVGIARVVRITMSLVTVQRLFPSRRGYAVPVDSESYLHSFHHAVGLQAFFRLPTPFCSRISFHAFFLPFSTACLLAAFLRLLLIMTTLRKLPTTAEPNNIKITGMRIAHTLGGKKSWSGWPLSTKGYGRYQRKADSTVVRRWYHQ